MSVYKYQPLVVYQNLKILCRYRLITTSHTWLDDEALVRKLQSEEYLEIRGVQSRPNGAKSRSVSLLLIAPGSEYASALAKFRRLYGSVYKDDLELLILITETSVSNYIKKTLGSEFTKSRPDFAIRDYAYRHFTIVVPEHVQVPKHEFASAEEIAEQSHGDPQSLRRMEKIYDTDPAAIWLGAEPGDLLRIVRPSESSLTTLVYRYCIRG